MHLNLDPLIARIRLCSYRRAAEAQGRWLTTVLWCLIQQGAQAPLGRLQALRGFMPAYPQLLHRNGDLD